MKDKAKSGKKGRDEEENLPSPVRGSRNYRFRFSTNSVQLAERGEYIWKVHMWGMSASVYIADYRVDTGLRLNKTECRSSISKHVLCVADKFFAEVFPLCFVFQSRSTSKCKFPSIPLSAVWLHTVTVGLLVPVRSGCFTLLTSLNRNQLNYPSSLLSLLSRLI